MLNMTIEVVEGLQKGKEITLDSTQSMIIGRSKSAHLQIGIDDRLISRTHCILEIRHGKCVVTDLNSRNGTFVNETKINSQVLNNMDEIRVGSTRMRVIIEQKEGKILICSACGGQLPEDETGVHAREVEHEDVLCTRCWKIRLDATVRVECSDFFAAMGLKGKTYTCGKCQADVSNSADFDGLACEFPDSTYVCPECVKAMRKDTQTYDLDEYYLVLKEIGRGGMGVVYKAIHKDTGRICALKKIHPSAMDDPKNIKIFEREMMVQSRVVHPNLVRIMDKGIVSRTYYFVMEFIQGGSVPSLMNTMRGRVLPPWNACAIAVNVLNGLSALHCGGFIHRDIKPSNILLTPPKGDGLGLAKICDYGLAKSFVKSGNSFLDITKTQGGFAGSVMYMSPEIIKNFKYAKPTVDLYSTGVTLYFMLTGKYTVNISEEFFKNMGKGMSPMQRHPLDIVMEDAPIPILNRRLDIPESLAAIVDKSVSKDIANGFQDAEEFKAAIEAVMESEGWK
ncbi:protein kinase domain-containing protein [Candidatus Magnetominusculus dajiuhuensis]|uniref:protein kinase domain-containing protein n=1 Tax=Candidatus Magnetominusculus dajiuhuensis TaxID=3137712 RepID=UPI003B42BAE5